MGRTNYWENLIIIGVFLGMRLFEYVMEYRKYECPTYCAVEHKHIKDNNGLRTIIQTSTTKSE